MGKDQDQIVYTSKKLDNDRLVMGATEEVFYDITSDGVDVLTSPYKKFFNFGREALGVVIQATAVCSLTEFNGTVLKSPRTINVGANRFEMKCANFKIVSIGATVLEVTIK